MLKAPPPPHKEEGACELLSPSHWEGRGACALSDLLP